MTNVKYIGISVINSIEFCVNKLVPSLFPFVIISCFLLDGNWIDKLFLGFKNTSKSILGICKIYYSSIIIGMLFGFVNGVSKICDAYNENRNSETSFFSAIFLTSNAGVGFVVGCVGITIWNDASLGVALYIFQIICAIIVHLIFNKREKSLVYSYLKKDEKGIVSSFVNSIKKALNTMLTICAFNIVFEMISELIIKILSFKNSTLPAIIIKILFDFSKGVFSIGKGEYLSIFLTGFSVAFGGVSVIMQTIAFCDSTNLNKLKFILLKALQGLLCGFFMILYLFVKNNFFN